LIAQLTVAARDQSRRECGEFKGDSIAAKLLEVESDGIVTVRPGAVSAASIRARSAARRERIGQKP